jgi:hypothetical protein
MNKARFMTVAGGAAVTCIAFLVGNIPGGIIIGSACFKGARGMLKEFSKAEKEIEYRQSQK